MASTTPPPYSISGGSGTSAFYTPKLSIILRSCMNQNFRTIMNLSFRCENVSQAPRWSYKMKWNGISFYFRRKWSRNYFISCYIIRKWSKISFISVWNLLKIEPPRKNYIIRSRDAHSHASFTRSHNLWRQRNRFTT